MGRVDEIMFSYHVERLGPWIWRQAESPMQNDGQTSAANKHLHLKTDKNHP